VQQLNNGCQVGAADGALTGKPSSDGSGLFSASTEHTGATGDAALDEQSALLSAPDLENAVEVHNTTDGDA
jgi:hypothetical protein